jgi:metallo-beta-lactamase class B
MNSRIVGLTALLVSVSAGGALAQGIAQGKDEPTVEQLVSSARALAGTAWPGVYRWLCAPSMPTEELVTPTVNPADFADPMNPPRNADGTRPLDAYYAAPRQIGENFYWLGTRFHSTYALVADNGDIILIDGNYEEFTEVEIFEGLRKLGLDPANVTYQLISHAHGDHDGGVAYTQQTYPWITIVYGPRDWPTVEARTVPHAVRTGPENDGTDGRVITAGSDVSIRILETPGHTPGTISFLFDYRDLDGTVRHVAYSLGLAISFTNTDPAYYDEDIASIRKMAQAAAEYGADVVLGNHSEYDQAYMKANVLAQRNPGEQDPFVVGPRGVINYFGVVELCNMATKLRATGIPALNP